MRVKSFKEFKCRMGRTIFANSEIDDLLGGGGGSDPAPSSALTIDALEGILDGADGGSGGETTPPPSPPNPAEGSSPDVPTGEGGVQKPTEPPAGAQPTAPVPPAGVPGTQPTGEGLKPGETPAAPTPQEAEIALMKSQLEQYQTLFNTMQQQQAAQQQPGQPGAAPEPAAEGGEANAVPDYTFNIPEGLMTALDSEDPGQRKLGIGALAQGVAQTVHRTIMEQVATAQKTLMDDIPNMVSEMVTAGNTAQQTTADFYGKYPQLDKPGIHELVKNVGAQVLQATGATEWSPQLRDMIAAKTFEVLKSVGGTTPTQAVPPSTPPSMLNGGGGGGSARGNSAPDIADEIAALANF